MKFSEAMLKGYAKNGGKQCVNDFQDDDGAMCVWGAYNLAVRGNAHDTGPVDGPLLPSWMSAFEHVWGFDPVSLNNNDSMAYDTEPFPWEHIYGMAVAAGL